MKRIVYIIMLVVVAVSMSSCSSVRNVKIVGEPGTVIEVPSQKGTYMIDNTGEVTVPLDRSYYHAYLLSTAPGSDLKVPFALDYKKNNSVYWKSFVAYGGATIFLESEVLGVVGAALGEGGLAAGGLLGGLVLMPVFMPFMYEVQDCNDVQHKYKYLKRYSTNDDMFGTARRGALYNVLGSSGVTR